MWWNGPGCGPMYGWWFMPILGIIFLLIFLFIAGRFFGGGFCGRPPVDRDTGIEDLKKEIRALRDEVKELKDRKADKT